MPSTIDDAVSFSHHRGASLRAHMEELARLRIRVFREYPYLYDGDMAYEQEYLETYATSPDALMILAHAEGRIVGASSCVPLASETASLRTPLEKAGWPVADTLYLGESVVLREYRGVGLGVRFFADREAHARDLGLHHCVFCSVERPPDDPRRPPTHQPLDGFWRRRGYEPLPDTLATLSWREIGAGEESDHAMRFWARQLDP